MNGAYGIATPKTDEGRALMQERIGRDHFYFEADPIETKFESADGFIPVFCWPLDALDPMIRISLVVHTSRDLRYSIKQAHALLTDMGVTFVQKDVDLTYTDTLPNDWATAYPVSERKAE